jgi:hypothetical protein
MKRLLFGLALCVLLPTGCAQRYDLTLRNGNVIRATTKPVLDESGFYVFKDLNGEETRIGMGRVRQLAPASWRRTSE